MGPSDFVLTALQNAALGTDLKLEVWQKLQQNEKS